MSAKRLLTPNQIITSTVRSIYTEYLSSSKLNLSPSYQRLQCWSPSQKCGLIGSIMVGWPTPMLTFYKLQSTDPGYTSGFRYECVDGSNRLSCLGGFFRGDTHIFWTAEDGSKKTYATLPEDDKEYFESYPITITIIQSPMTLDERKAMFTRLQDGTKISAAEKIKNSEHPICQFVSRTGLRDRFYPVAEDFMAGHKGDWMNVLADCATLYITREDEESRYACLDRSVATLKDELNLKHAPRYTLAEADVAPLTAVFEQLLTFLAAVKGLPLAKAPICHKFHVEVLFGMILHGDPLPTPERASQSFIRKVQKDIVSRSGKDRKETLEELYTSIQEELEAEKVAKVEKKGPRPPKKTRLQLWANYFGEEREGSCQVCSCVITAAKWEQAHIIPHSTGAVGTNAITNLVPTCMECNRSCQTRDLREFAADTHTDAPFLKKLGSSAASASSTD